MAEYISRELVMDALLHEQYGSLCEDAISSIPSADVAPRCPHYIRNVHDRGDDSLCQKWECEVKDVAPVRHGTWIKMDMHKGMEQHRCSVCNQECYVPTCMGEPLYVYCPNCGALMNQSYGPAES